MFRHPAWVVGSYSSGPPAARTVGTPGAKSMGGLNRQDGSPCSIDSAAIKAPLTLSVAIDHTSFSLLFATLISDFRQHGRARGEGRNAIRLKTDQRNLEVQKGMVCWKDGREGDRDQISQMG